MSICVHCASILVAVCLVVFLHSDRVCLCDLLTSQTPGPDPGPLIGPLMPKKYKQFNGVIQAFSDSCQCFGFCS